MTFIVAEIGVNWDGKKEIAVEMIQKCKNLGCTAVKFQAFNEKIIENHPEKDRLLEAAVTEDNIEFIDRTSKKIGIEWFCTPMYPNAIDFLEPFVNRFKIREFDARTLLENKKSSLLDKIFQTNKEIIASSEIIPPTITQYDVSKLKWLYCIPKYPCSLEDLNFVNLKNFDGFSNHCPNIIAPTAARILGSEIIEIHVTSDKSKDFVDNNVSFDFRELEILVNYILDFNKINKS